MWRVRLKSTTLFSLLPFPCLFLSCSFRLAAQWVFVDLEYVTFLSCFFLFLSFHLFIFITAHTHRLLHHFFFLSLPLQIHSSLHFFLPKKKERHTPTTSFSTRRKNKKRDRKEGERDNRTEKYRDSEFFFFFSKLCNSSPFPLLFCWIFVGVPSVVGVIVGRGRIQREAGSKEGLGLVGSNGAEYSSESPL